MPRKSLLVLVLAVFVTVGAFAQFFISGEVSTDFSSITPSLGIGFGFEKLDILSGFSVSISQETYQYDTSDGRTGDDKKNNRYTYSNTLGIYTGIALKATHEKWTVSVPLLASIYFGEKDKLTFDDSDTQKTSTSAQPANQIFGFAFMVGGRGEYAFSEHWSIYTGFLWNVIKFEQVWYNSFKRVLDYNTMRYINGSERLDYTTETVSLFRTGLLQLGVSYKF